MNKNKITRILSLLFIVLFYFVGVITDGLLILGAALPPSPSVWIPVLAGHVLTSFMIFIIPIITILLFLNQYKKVGNHGISKKGILSILAVGLIILTPMLIHISRASSTAYRVESRFTEGWGEEWRKDITAPQ